MERQLLGWSPISPERQIKILDLWEEYRLGVGLEAELRVRLDSLTDGDEKSRLESLLDKECREKNISVFRELSR